MLKIKEVTSSTVACCIGDALKRHVGRGREYSYEEFAALTGCKKRTVEGWVRNENPPEIPSLIKCLILLPPDFANSLLAMAGLCGAYEEGGSSSSVEVNVKAAELVSLISVHLQDMKIDHRELAEQVPLVRELHTVCGAFLKEHERSGGAGS